jgi:hypothetical protein
MSKLEVNAVEPQCGTNLTLGASGDTIIIPSGATISNQGTAAGFGPTGAVSWNTTKITADPNPAVTGVGYFADTTSAAFTITLPSSPSAGAVVGIADYANTFATNNLTVGRNGSNIGGVASNSILSTSGVSVTFVYVDATQGWIVTDSGNRSDLPPPQFVAATGGTITTTPCGNFKVHTFTGPGTFTVSCAGNSGGSNSVDYLVVAGGGGGGGSNCAPSDSEGGGGGAGGYRESSGTASGCYSASPLGSGVSALPVSAQGYPITVGAGGAGTASNPTRGSSGAPSIFSTITSTGGGGGGARSSPNAPGARADNGGSGGGTGQADDVPTQSFFGTGNTPPVAPSQGNPGGKSAFPSSPGSTGGGGGGGAGGTGGDATPGPSVGGAGGAGTTSSINATPTARAGGGGGAGTTGGTATSGGGNGNTTTSAGGAGTVNTGGGGGGSGPGGGGTGGSGIVVIRYKFQ